MLTGCPGTFNMKTPTLKIKKCPECGSDVELFSIDVQVACETCGFLVFNDIQSCIQWCKYARDCVGEELYMKLKKRRVLFVGERDAARTQMARAVASKFNEDPHLEFSSVGIDPAQQIDPLALELILEEGMEWKAKPRPLPLYDDSDIIVMMGCDGVENLNADARTIEWEIGDPHGKGMDEYRKTFAIIKDEVKALLKELK